VQVDVCEQRRNRRVAFENAIALDIAMGGSTISDFLNASGEAGYFQLELAVYGKADKPCPRCQTPIVRSLIGGRASFHCPSCQPN